MATTPEQRAANVKTAPWQYHEDDMLEIYITESKLPDAAVRTIMELTGRSDGAVRQRYLILKNRRAGILPKHKRERLAAQQQHSNSTATAQPAAAPQPQPVQAIPAPAPAPAGAIQVLDVTRAQKELMDKICTVVHNVNGKYFILQII